MPDLIGISVKKKIMKVFSKFNKFAATSLFKQNRLISIPEMKKKKKKTISW
jgi:hypothetical protein